MGIAEPSKEPPADLAWAASALESSRPTLDSRSALAAVRKGRVDRTAERTSHDDPEQTIQQLRTALDSRVVIEQAKGILAERFSLSLDEAFVLLRRAARTQRMPLRSLARTVVERPDCTPAGIVALLARSSL